MQRGERQRRDAEKLILEKHHRGRANRTAREREARVAFERDRGGLDQHVAHIHRVAERDQADGDQNIGDAGRWQEGAGGHDATLPGRRNDRNSGRLTDRKSLPVEFRRLAGNARRLQFRADARGGSCIGDRAGDQM